MTKEEIIALVQECTARLGRAPTGAEFLAMRKVSKRQVLKNFGSHTRMLAASGVEGEGPGYMISMRSLFLDWAGVVRSLGKVPTVVDYERLGKYSVRPFSDRFGNWRDVPAGMLEWARKEGLEGEWQDVMDIIALHQQRATRAPRTFGTTSATTLRSTFRTRWWRGAQPPGSSDRAALARVAVEVAYGHPLPHSLLSYAPTNEAGVVLLFGSMARELGFVVLRAQAGFPDCEAMREIESNRWEKSADRI